MRVICDSAEALDGWKRYAHVCIDQIEQLLGPEGETKQVVTIYFGDAERTRANGPFHLVLRPGQDMLSLTDEVVRTLVLRRLTPADAVRPPDVPSVAWVSAAITNRILFGRTDATGWSRPDYEPARFLFSRGKYPEVARLISAPVASSNPVLFRLYALHCDLLAACLEDSGAGVTRQLLVYETHGRPTVEALEFLLQDTFERGDNLQSWYERTVIRVSRRGRRISDADTVAQRLDDLLTVPVVTAGSSDFRGKRMPIEEVPETLDVFKVDRQAMGRLQGDLYELLKDAPELLRPPLVAFMNACAVLGRGKVRAARRAFRDARRDFHEALALQRGAESYLNELERDYVPADRRLGLYLDIMEEQAAAKRRLDPRLHEYLDSLSE